MGSSCGLPDGVCNDWRSSCGVSHAMCREWGVRSIFGVLMQHVMIGGVRMSSYGVL